MRSLTGFCSSLRRQRNGRCDWTAVVEILEGKPRTTVRDDQGMVVLSQTVRSNRNHSMKKLKYKIGDDVWVKAKVVNAFEDVSNDSVEYQVLISGKYLPNMKLFVSSDKVKKRRDRMYG